MMRSSERFHRNRSWIQLGIDAPRKITVHREEVFREIQEENIKAHKARTAELQQAQKILGEKKGEGEDKKRKTVLK